MLSSAAVKPASSKPRPGPWRFLRFNKESPTAAPPLPRPMTVDSQRAPRRQLPLPSYYHRPPPSPSLVPQRYREKLLRFRLDVLPLYKHRLQSRLYRLLVRWTQRRAGERRSAGSRLLDLAGGRRWWASRQKREEEEAEAARRAALARTSALVRRQLRAGRAAIRAEARGRDGDSGGGSGVAACGLPKEQGQNPKYSAEEQDSEEVRQLAQDHTGKMSSAGSYWGYGYGSSRDGSDGSTRESGARRKKLAAMAGSVYRAGVAAAGEMREQYNNTRFRNVDNSIDPQMTIPGSFPNVAIVTKGDEQMVLFPSYAKRHIRQFDKDGNRIGSGGGGAAAAYQQQGQQGGHQQYPTSQAPMNDEEYWHNEWAKVEDEKAVVDVDVRGWVYSPHKGPMTRKNRILIGLARRMSGIPPPTIQPDAGSNDNGYGGLPHHSMSEEHEDLREQQKIAREAEEIERRGRGEEEVATRGGYSEATNSRRLLDASETSSLRAPRSGAATPAVSPPGSPSLAARQTGGTTAAAADLTEAELAVANANLMARLGPFLTTPLVRQPVTIFFYNDSQSQSKTVTTNDAGHFSIRAALDFVPTDIRVLANEDLSATEPVRVVEPRGVSLISDIDDTIKRSNISLGAREIFRNTFIRDLGDMAVPGAREWYGALHSMGVQIHYCSNSPWQLFPVLATFFHGAGLPPGSLHLKHYAGMLQGIFEPVAERKKGTLERIMADFPERRFLLVGDSGEADLEVYTDLAQANPGRILAIFIRDVTTPETPPQQQPQQGFFDSNRRGAGGGSFDDHLLLRPPSSGGGVARRPVFPTRTASVPPKTEAPLMGNLIDLSDEPEPLPSSNSETLSLAGLDLGGASKPAAAGKRPPPARPAKPASLRGAPSDSAVPLASSGQGAGANHGGHVLSKKPSNLGGSTGGVHPLMQMQTPSSSSVQTQPMPRRTRTADISATSTGGDTNNNNNNSYSSSPSPPASGGDGSKPAPPPPRRRGTPSSAQSGSSGARMLAYIQQKEQQQQQQQQQQNRLSYTHNSDTDVDRFEGLGPPSASSSSPDPISRVSTGGTTRTTTTTTTTTATTTTTTTALDKKVALWHGRLTRAHEVLAREGVALYTWRRGDDVVLEAQGIVRDALREMERGGGGGKRRVAR
ncbi:hypothetical protein RB594_005963 [Gaeumannomyces avenae]